MGSLFGELNELFPAASRTQGNILGSTELKAKLLQAAIDHIKQLKADKAGLEEVITGQRERNETLQELLEITLVSQSS